MTAPTAERAPFSAAQVAVALAALALINAGFAAALIWPSYVTQTVPGQIPDFAAFWASARLTLEGNPAVAYDWTAHRAVEAAGLGRAFDGWMPWLYPPPAQLMVAPLGLLELYPAMMVWLGVTGGLFLATCWRILPHRNAVLAGLAAAPTGITLVNGQMGFLIAAVLGLALLALPARPVAAGLTLALVAIKPHLVAAVPLVLIGAGRWRVVAAGAAGTAALAALALGLLPGSWPGFFGAFDRLATMMTGSGDDAQRWIMGANPYGWLRLHGLGATAALAVQGAVAVAVIWLTIRAWRAPGVTAESRAALLCFATLAASPRVLNYDLHILVIGALFQVRHGLAAGFAPWEPWVLAAAAVAGIAGLVAPPGVTAAIPLVLFLACWAAQGRAARG